MYTDFQQLAIICLVMFYILINIYYKQLLNIGIFLINFIMLSLVLNNKTNAIIIAYIICIIYNIYKNFHLLENFEPNNTINLDNFKPKVKNNPKNKHINDTLLNITERLLNKFIEKTQKLDPKKIATRQVKVSDLLPTKKNLSPIKIKQMKNNKEILNKPIVITNDNFIIDGHYRWHINNSLNDEYIKATIISSDVKNFLKDITIFKKEYNIDELGKFTIDKNKLNKAKKSINIIIEHINLLNEYQKDLDKINVV